MSRFRNSLFLAKLFFSLPVILLGCLLAVEASAGVGGRVTADLQALYLFGEGSGQKVYDVSGTSASQDLTIEDSAEVNWLPGGGLYIGSATQLRSGVAPSAFIASVKTNGALTVEAWVKPASLTQSGPARIVSLSQDSSNRDFTLGQSASAYDIRLRTTETSENGLPSVTTPSGVVEAALQHIVYTRDTTGAVAVYVDGLLVMDSVVGGVATNWHESYELVLANERTGDRPWLGELHLVALYDRALTSPDVAQNHAAGTDALSGTTFPPQILPASGTVIDEATVTLTSLTEGVALYYSLDGTTTLSAMTPYTGPFTLTSDALVTTVAVKTGLQQSLPSRAHYTVVPFTGRTTAALKALYLFGEGSGHTVYDISGASTSLDLMVEDSSAVSWLPGGGLLIGSATQLRSGVAASGLVSAVKSSGALTIEAWVRPASTSQSAPSRIVSLSQDPYNRDFTFGQSGSAYDIRLRTTDTSDNGIPSITTPSGVVQTALQHVVYTRNTAGAVAIYLDGQLVTDGSVAGALTNWESGYELVLANERSGERPWLGELHLVALYDRALSGIEIAQNHAADPDLLDTITYPPQIFPAAGEIVTEVNVTLTSLTAGATIYYSLDGSTTPSAMTPYTGPFTLTSDATVTTVAVKTGFQPSVPKSAHYTVTPFTGRTTAGLQAFYNFTQGSGQQVYDRSGVGAPLNLDIEDSAAVSWLPDGGITISSATQLRSGIAANKLTSSMTASSALTIEAWVKPANSTQSGPSRIVSLSQDPYNRDFTLGQSGSAYDTRLRTSETSENGLPSVTTPSGMVKNTQQHIVYTRDTTGAVATYVDGLLVMDSVVAGTLANWDDNYELMLANERTGDRPWLGDLYLIALYDRALSAAELAQNRAAGPHGDASQLDTTPPTITFTVAPEPNGAGWHRSDVTITFTCTDSESGIADCPAPITVTTEGASQVVSGTATDVAGNSATTSVSVNLDKTAPAILISSPSNGASVTDPLLTITGTVSDANPLSGFTINGVSVTPDGSGAFTHTLTLIDGVNAISVQATDIADNVTVVPLSVTYDPPPLIADFPELTVGTGSGVPGDVVQIPVNYVSDGSVTTLQVDIQFNAGQLSAWLPIAGGALGVTHDLETSQPQTGLLRIVITPPPDNAVLATGVLATIPFTINAAAINGDESLTVGNSVMVDGAAVEVIPDTFDAGLITITGAP